MVPTQFFPGALYWNLFLNRFFKRRRCLSFREVRFLKNWKSLKKKKHIFFRWKFIRKLLFGDISVRLTHFECLHPSQPFIQKIFKHYSRLGEISNKLTLVISPSRSWILESADPAAWNDWWSPTRPSPLATLTPGVDLFQASHSVLQMLWTCRNMLGDQRIMLIIVANTYTYNTQFRRI